MERKIALIDGYSLLFRAFHALPLMDNGEGEYTNAVYGFMSMLLKVLQTEQPRGEHRGKQGLFQEPDEEIRHPDG